MQEDDRSLVSAVVRGNKGAFKRLIEQHQTLVAHMIYRIVDDEMDREELCQDVFVRVYDKLHEFQFQSKLSTWIATIAYRTAINHVNKNKVRFTELEEVKFHQTEMADVAESSDFTAFVHRLIDQLPMQYRNVLTLYYVQGFSYPEIVSITEMPEGTVKNYLYRAKEKLRTLSEPYLKQELEGYGFKK